MSEYSDWEAVKAWLLTQSTTSPLLLSSLVSQARRINTTAPLTGGGDLTGDLTLGFSGAIPSFVDGEVAGGSGTAWTLANTPSGTPQVFAIIPGTGLVGLVSGSASSYGYTIVGANITTVTSYSAGSLLAWYRH